MKQFILFFVVLSLSNCLEKPSVEDVEQFEINYIANNYNKKRVDVGLNLIEYSTILTNLAQNEAKRLAGLKKLVPPKFQTDRYYVGQSFKIRGLIGKNFSRFNII